jgi:hypothetical protein
MPALLFFDRIKLIPKQFVHLKHVYSALLEDRLQLIVANYLTLVVGVLELVSFDVFPEFLDHLGTRKLDSGLAHA